MTELDIKIVERIQKLLNLARDGGATEGEANNAMEMAERLMLANNLSIAQVEMSGGAATEKRLKEQSKGRANYRWQRWLMSAIATANYCHVLSIVEKRRIRYGAERDYVTGYQIIGRASNVASTKVMYDYLLQTCARLRADYEMNPGRTSRDGALFVEGLAFRLAQRVEERHEEMLRKQRREAEEAKARAAHPAAAPTGNALVVVMEDFAAKEADLNNDLRRGWEPGTTLAKRLADDAASRAQDEKIRELMKEHHISYDIAWNMVHLQHTLERAKEYQAQFEAGRGKSRYRGGKTREDRLHERLYTGSAGEGRRAAEKVSLNQQVGSGSDTRRIK